MAITWKIVNTDYTVKGAKGTNQIHQLHWTCTDAETVDGTMATLFSPDLCSFKIPIFITVKST